MFNFLLGVPGKHKYIDIGIVELCFLHFLITVTKGLAKVQEGRKKEGGQEGVREEWLILAH